MEEKASVVTPQENQGMSYETKTIIVILCLLFLTPIGLILMWVWMKWPLWLRILLTILPFLLAFAVAGFVVWVLTMVFSNPDVQKQIHEQIQNQQQQTPSVEIQPTSQTENENLSITPTGIYSSQGQSCGPNAGAAGDAQCTSGLTCMYKTPEEKTQGIGTCVTQ